MWHSGRVAATNKRGRLFESCQDNYDFKKIIDKAEIFFTVKY